MSLNFKTIVRAAASPIMWLAYEVGIWFPLWLIGMPVTAALLAASNTALKASTVYPDRRIREQFKPRWAWLWSNEEDGVLGPLWYNPEQTKWRAWLWSAQRNSVNNLRFVPGFNVVIKPREVWSTSWDGGWFAGQGFRTNLRLTVKGWRVWVGWKVLPTDHGPGDRLDKRDYRYPGAGFATQLKRE